MTGAVAETHEFEQFLGPLLGFAVTLSGNEGGNHDVFECRELRQELVELEDETDVAVAEVGEFFVAECRDVGVVDDHRTAVGLVERADNLQEGGLAGSRGAYDTDHLALADVERDALEHL